MARVAKIQPLKNRFDRTAQQSLNLIADVRSLVKPPPAGPGHPGLPQFQFNLIYELAFLRCVLAWEDFLHTSMCAYLTGAIGLGGAAPQPKVKAPSLGVADDLLVGEQHFLSWTMRDTVRDRAKVWFENGEPYESTLQGFPNYGELRTVRNRIVHRSESAQHQFRKLVRQRHPNTDVRGMGPGAFLSRTTAGASRLDGYIGNLLAAVAQIANN